MNLSTGALSIVSGKIPAVFILILFLTITILGAGCTTKGIPGIREPSAGTWNGYVARIDGEPPFDITSPLGKDVARMKLNIYDDGTFEYVTNYSIRNGTLTSTGKGNFIIRAMDDETTMKYFHYDSGLDTLKWESMGTIIEFRRNDRELSHQGLVQYTNQLIAEAPTPTPEVTILYAEITPVPTYEVARIESEGFSYDPTSQTIYQLNGQVRIAFGIFDSVKVIVRYPDNDEYYLDVGGMGGANYTKKDFKVILNSRVEMQDPSYFIRLDNEEYSAIVSNESSGPVTLIIAYTRA
jgi:hypothetical protein